MAVSQKILIGISSCLIGNKVRYDGNDQYHPLIIETLKADYQLVPFCPEMAIGLGVPREKIQLVEINQQIVCLDEKTHRIDYTQALKDCCQQQIEQLKQLSGYIFKTKSPSCGLSKVKTLYPTNSDLQGEIIANGEGIFASQLKSLFPQMPVIEEDQFESMQNRTEFINAVNKYYLKSLQ